MKQQQYTETRTKKKSRFIKDNFKDTQPLTSSSSGQQKCKTTIVSHLESSRVDTSQVAKKQHKKWVNHRLELHIKHKLAYTRFNLIKGWPINMQITLTERSLCPVVDWRTSCTSPGHLHGYLSKWSSGVSLSRLICLVYTEETGLIDIVAGIHVKTNQLRLRLSSYMLSISAWSWTRVPSMW